MRLPNRIEPFKEGDNTRTAFSADVMNELISVCNAVLQMRGVNGVRVFPSDSGIVIDANITGSGGAGTQIINQTINNSQCLCKYL